MILWGQGRQEKTTPEDYDSGKLPLEEVDGRADIEQRGANHGEMP